MNAIYAMNATDTTNAAGDVVRCPTCGHLRLVQVSDEGTSSFVPVPQPLEPCDCRERDALAARVAELEANNQQLEVQVAELTKTVNILDQERDMACAWAETYRQMSLSDIDRADRMLQESIAAERWRLRALKTLQSVKKYWDWYRDKMGPIDSMGIATIKEVQATIEASGVVVERAAEEEGSRP